MSDFLIGMCVGFAIGCVFFAVISDSDWKRESAIRGHSYWTVDVNGNKEWHWKTNCIER